MTDASPGLRRVGQGTFLAGVAIAAAGALLFTSPQWYGPTIWPFTLVVTGILVAAFGFFWLLALKRQRLWLPRDALGPQPPGPPDG